MVYHAARLSGNNPKMEVLPFSEFIPKWGSGGSEEPELADIPVEESQKGLLTKVMAAFGLKKPS